MADTQESPKIDEPFLDELISEVNRQLQYDQQLRKDDPAYAIPVSINVALKKACKPLQQDMEKMLHHLTASSEQQIKKSEQISQQIITKTTETLAKTITQEILKELNVEREQYRKELQALSEQTKLNLGIISKLSFIGAVSLAALFSGMAGMCLWNVIAHLFFNTK